MSNHEDGFEKHVIDAEIVHKSSELIQALFKSYQGKQLELSGSVDFTNKADGSVVTELDEEIERAVQAEIRAKFPDIPVYGEETGYGDTGATTFWLIDPIDGTKSFIDGTLTFTNMAAMIHNGETVASIIYNPTEDAMYTAFRGEGAFKNGEMLSLGSTVPQPVILCKKELFADVQRIFEGEELTLQNPPSGGGNGLAMVAEGKVAARFQIRANGVAHDYAPGALLVTEAGGVLVPVLSDEYAYESNSFIACHPLLADLMQRHQVELRSLEQ